MGRTPSLIKLKTYSSDMEGMVVGKGERNSIEVKLPSGRVFTVPSQDVLIPSPSIGDVVTFSYDNNARREIPLNPKILRVRTDVLWEESIRNAYKEARQLNDQSNIRGQYTAKPARYWTSKNMRKFMDHVARSNDMDPLLPSTWYSIGAKQIAKYKGGTTILTKFGGYFNALRKLFPDIKLDHTGFIQSSWRGIEDRRQFFESYASANGFDPLLPDNWYSQRLRKICSFKGGYGIIAGRLYDSLLDVFPNIGLDPSKFRRLQYHVRENRIKFFENYAKERGFDPLNPENWYSQKRELIETFKGATTIIRYHDSLKSALLDLFPNIGLDKSKFWRRRKGLT